MEYEIVNVSDPEKEVVYKYKIKRGPSYLVRFVQHDSYEFKTSPKQIFVYYVLEKEGEEYAVEVENDSHPIIRRMIHSVARFRDRMNTPAGNTRANPIADHIILCSESVTGELDGVAVSMRAGMTSLRGQSLYTITYPSGQTYTDVADLASGLFRKLSGFYDRSSKPIDVMYTKAERLFDDEKKKPLPTPEHPIRFNIDGDSLIPCSE